MEQISNVLQGWIAYALIFEIVGLCSLVLAFLGLMLYRTRNLTNTVAVHTASTVNVVVEDTSEYRQLNSKFESLEQEYNRVLPMKEEYSQMQEKVKFLESKLLEYEILQEEIGALGQLKTENERLKTDLMKLQNQKATPAPAPVPQAPAPVSAPIPVASPEPAFTAPIETPVVSMGEAAAPTNIDSAMASSDSATNSLLEELSKQGNIPPVLDTQAQIDAIFAEAGMSGEVVPTPENGLSPGIPQAFAPAPSPVFESPQPVAETKIEMEMPSAPIPEAATPVAAAAAPLDPQSEIDRLFAEFSKEPAPTPVAPTSIPEVSAEPTMMMAPTPTPTADVPVAVDAPPSAGDNQMKELDALLADIDALTGNGPADNAMK